MARVYLGLGSNIDDKKEHIDNAIDLLQQHEAINVINTSSYYETDPVGYIHQDIFLNAVVEITTTLEPYNLLAYCNHIEETLKRKRIIRWGPRTIDVDILLFENYTTEDEKLTIPHPRMVERAFVMVPLYELAKDIIIHDKNIRHILENLDTEGIRKVENEG
ncbi:2-amino-4-hydroxy-6-hydroxymethyldihydropteridinediphosphokinase [Natronincola peptidivorans]|uniref:2-amino-4-hydroxy-6-hydroxymethyldihydropteridine diphosphokinase n=1 Tax=Natronincola peptidivorans TaxID=426128 RepID=A0A1I0DM93_9FIRM|nr:2-amino-4-hydroxy-6-hydroxymethyldihydropteridine diphosphokinase [Natronincola peptidivorans]SET33606.1 2-amino-4-hydroxy-6-hydroxymethyldihydropteridinediphosphokinase [Natronincola peptidivorans]